jgi:phage tail-like protein
MAVYPTPVFHFTVDWKGQNVGFSEVSGLTQEIAVIEYRSGDSPSPSSIKLSGLRKYNNITLKRGVVKSDNEFFTWLKTVSTKEIERRDLTITLRNENLEPVMIWQALNCWPVKVEGPSLKANGTEVAIESIEIATEGVEVKND